MTRYMAICCSGNAKSFERILASELNRPIWCMDKKPPDVAFAELKIKIIKKEKRYKKGSYSFERNFNIFGFTVTLRRTSKERI